MAVSFKPATRQAVKARIALSGPSGTGKTYTALAIATGLANHGGIAVVDTEHGSASTYSDEFDFDVLELDAPFSPTRYVEAIKAAEAADYSVIVLDSISHAWSAEGGVLDIVDKATARSKSGNKWAAWREGTPQQNALVEGIVGARCHIIATMRTKTAYVQDKDESTGKTEIRKVGLEPVQRDQIDYEFGIAGELDHAHRLVITKSRFKSLQDVVVERPDESFGTLILGEISKGIPADEPEKPPSNAGGGNEAEGGEPSGGLAPSAQAVGTSSPESPPDASPYERYRAALLAVNRMRPNESESITRQNVVRPWARSKGLAYPPTEKTWKPEELNALAELLEAQAGTGGLAQ